MAFYIDMGFVLFVIIIMVFVYFVARKEKTIIKWLIYVSFFIIFLLSIKFYAFFIPSPGWPTPFFPYRPGIWYDDVRHSSMMIATVAFTILAILLSVIIAKKDYKIKLKLSIFGLIFSILSYASFYFLNLDYVYREYPKVFMYTSLDGEYITNKDRYFSLVEKYGFNIGSYAKFKTLDESIKALEFAKKVGSKGVYYRVFEDMERFGYDKVFQKYKDKTFQVYFLRILISINTNEKEERDFFINNYVFLKLISINSTFEDIRILSKKILESYLNIDLHDLEKDDGRIIDETYRLFRKDVFNMNGINKNIFN